MISTCYAVLLSLHDSVAPEDGKAWDALESPFIGRKMGRYKI